MTGHPQRGPPFGLEEANATVNAQAQVAAHLAKLHAVLAEAVQENVCRAGRRVGAAEGEEIEGGGVGGVVGHGQRAKAAVVQAAGRVAEGCRAGGAQIVPNAANSASHRKGW